MDYNNLILMEIDKETGAYKGELGSFTIYNNENIKKFFYDGEHVNLYFDTNKDVEDWEYSAIFDIFPYDKFKDKGFIIEDIDDDYNPAWIIKFDLIEDNKKMQDRVDEVMNLIDESLEFCFFNIKDKKEDYL